MQEAYRICCKMEVCSLGGNIGNILLSPLAHQAALNTFWNDSMEAVVNSKSLLLFRKGTFMDGKEAKRKESIIFDRDAGSARFSRHEFNKGDTLVDNNFNITRMIKIMGVPRLIEKLITKTVPLTG